MTGQQTSERVLLRVTQVFYQREMSWFHLIVQTVKFFVRNVQPDQLFQVESFLERLKTLFIFPKLLVVSEYAI